MAGVYISYPFCAQKCTYCNFASGVFPRELEARYADALIAELRAHRASGDWAWTPETVYLGGGTPSQMDAEALARVLAEIPQHRADGWLEATMEAAPGGITPELVHAWRRAGINRVSLGVQSFVTREAQRTGRKHTAEIVAQEIAMLRDSGIVNFNIDLIAGLPGQTVEGWKQSLEWIARLEAPHVSIYMLEVDEDSRLGAEVLALGKRYGAPEIPSEDQIADCYEYAVEQLGAMGVPRYEISNFARPGFESRHNLKYWLREPYLGAGADAHSFDGVRRSQNIELAAPYVSRITGGESGVAEVSLANPIGERFFLGLRLDRGVTYDENEVSAEFRGAIRQHLAQGLLQFDGDRLRLTRRGVLLSNEVFESFVGVGEALTHSA